ncbi:YoaK family protein [Anaeromicropila populeti]|uniref:Uncharacterized membrane protein YoaK, UPF0700 family n=1 Tax=Anaeromicropila populeti TaxID=37658 RepID=A0A1I6KPW3_9FIRM|nr:YoaK family protein [Anaeromicropila populeti]SFR93256.1 Uncharacterized membrane protein YoaK, UPF0700 family [Anaeromicropila populeti]
MNQQKKMSESLYTAFLLAIVGGFLDAYSYIVRGHVFANAQTGNIVLLALNLAKSNFSLAFYYLIPILAFITGTLTTEILKYLFYKNRFIHWRQIILLVEVLFLIIVSFLPNGSMNSFANIILSFVCSMQVQSFRKINGNSYATTMCTGNLRSGTEQLFSFLLTKEKAHVYKCFSYFGVIVFFLLGAYVGSFLISYFGIKSILFCCILLMAVCILLSPSISLPEQ